VARGLAPLGSEAAPKKWACYVQWGDAAFRQAPSPQDSGYTGGSIVSNTRFAVISAAIIRCETKIRWQVYAGSQTRTLGTR